MLKLALFVLLTAGFIGCGSEEAVFLEAGSQGRPGDGAVQGLEPGTMYLVRSGNDWYTVRKNGTLGGRLLRLNRPLLEFAFDREPHFGPLDPGVTAISGLPNNLVISVYAFYRPDNDFYLVPDSRTELNNLRTWHKNTVVDLTNAAAFNMTAAFFSPGAIGQFSELIFVTPDIDNVPQDEIITGGEPVIKGGPEWEYRFNGGMGNVSESRPLIIRAASSPWQRGYFSLSGELPEKFTMVSKRNPSDPDMPSVR